MKGELVVFLCCLLCFGILEWYLHKKRERQLKELTGYLLRLQDGLELPAFSGYAEGQLGILESEIYKLVALLGEKSRREKKQSAYLAEMMSDISHQIKTPLAAVTLLTDLLKDPDLPEEKRIEFAEKIDAQAGKITWLIRNLLTMAQMEADMLKLKKEKTSARALAERACAPLEILAEMRGVTLHIDGEDDLCLVCDAAWTAEALSNVVKNCIEHTGQDAGNVPGTGSAGSTHAAGPVEGSASAACVAESVEANVSAASAAEPVEASASAAGPVEGSASAASAAESVEASAASAIEFGEASASVAESVEASAAIVAASGHVRIAITQNNFATTFFITDDGCGIAKEDLPHIFERFYKGRHASRNSVGIGLAMARQIIMLQNGTIQVESEEGKGSRFTVKLYGTGHSVPEQL